MLDNDVLELHENGVLQDDDMEKLAQLEADIIEASMKSGGSVLGVLADHLTKEGFDQADYDKAARYLESLGIEDDESEKTARIKLPKTTLGRLAGIAGPLLGTGMLLALGGEKLYSEITTRKAFKSVLSQIKKQNPELRRDPMTDQHYEVLTSFSPSLAKNAVVAANLLLKMKQWGAIDHKTVQDLITMEKNLAETRRPSTGFGDTIRAMTSFQRMVADVPLVGAEVRT